MKPWVHIMLLILLVAGLATGLTIYVPSPAIPPTQEELESRMLRSLPNGATNVRWTGVSKTSTYRGWYTFNWNDGTYLCRENFHGITVIKIK
jgi:hypothetical protein